MIMDEIKAAGWTMFKPVQGQAIAEDDLKKVFKMVDMDGSGAISQLVLNLHVLIDVKTIFSGIENGCKISWEKIWNK